MRAQGEARRQRILEVATEEFAARGFTGARINRIAADAKASKERLYAYFPDKGALFEAVVSAWAQEVTDKANFDGSNVLEYTGRLFDVLATSPQGSRLLAWLELERPSMIPTLLTPDGENKLEATRRAQASGTIDPSWDPLALVTVIIQIVRALVLLPISSPEDLTTRRNTAIEMVRRIIDNDVHRQEPFPTS
ncbi:TetR family transcriptional regulator [Streptomyces albidoflavus]|uniref:TetR family transcriptional regulator n=1 Tax=Streptomyces albidoflavus TaxID=1886 RepID=UPI0033B1E431